MSAPKARDVATTCHVIALLGMAWLAGGCQNLDTWDYDQKVLGKPGYTGPANPPDVSPDALTGVQMRHAPTVVEGIFRQDHPDAVVTRVEMLPDGSGRMVYQVTYLDDGIPGQVTYQASGADVRPPDVYIIRTREDDMHARPTHVPSTQPARTTSAKDDPV